MEKIILPPRKYKYSREDIEYRLLKRMGTTMQFKGDSKEEIDKAIMRSDILRKEIIHWLFETEEYLPGCPSCSNKKFK